MKTGLSHDVISEFVSITTNLNTTKEERTMYGTIVQDGERKYVKIDGSDMVTPVDTTASVKAGNRVTVIIKNHAIYLTAIGRWY